jgi:molybdenum cofactor biosynthesis protein MoaC
VRDVSAKIKTLRTAKAKATLRVSPKTITTIKDGLVPKGDPLPVAKVAAIQAAKNTSQIIPYCHPLPVDYVGVNFELNEDSIEIEVEVKAIYKTGVEMEALTAASVAALTIYDMTKMLDEQMEITGVHLVSKTGGKSDFKQPFSNSLKAAVLVMSDTISAGKKSDQSGQLIVERLKNEGLDVVDYKIVSDDTQEIIDAVKAYADKEKIDLVVTTGGTGVSPRDNTPEAMKDIIEREIPGIAEAIHAYGQERTPYSMISRSQAGIRNKTIVINLPGSSGGVKDSLDALFPAVLHAFKMLRGAGHESDTRTTKVASRK